MKIALVLLVAILSVLLSEAGLIAWLVLSGGWLDVTGSLWLRGVAPVVLVVVALQTAALWRVYRSAPLRFGLVYGAAYPLLHALALNLMGNPGADVARFLLTDLAAVALVIGGCWFLFWRVRPIGDEGGA